MLSISVSSKWMSFIFKYLSNCIRHRCDPSISQIFSVISGNFFTICPTVRMVVVDFLRVTILNCSSIVKAPKEQWQSIDVSSLMQRNLCWVQAVLPLFKKKFFTNYKEIYIWLHPVLLCHSFYGEFENEQKKDKDFFDLLEQGFEPQIFSNFPVYDLYFHERWGWQDQIKTSF